MLSVILWASIFGYGSAEQLSYPRCESANGLLERTLRVEVTDVHLDFKNISFRTRTYNGMFPGPILRAAPGDKVRIKLQNTLGRNTPYSGCHAPLSEFRAANSTNLHIHGIYDPSSQDNTFVCVEPGAEYIYNYEIDPRSGTSTLWYHPHNEGSTTEQLYGGMAGAFEIVDPREAENFGFAATHVMLLQALTFDPTSKEDMGALENNGKGSGLPLDLRNPHNYRGTVLLVNGKVGPSSSLEVGSYARLKMINALGKSTTNLNIGFQDADAESCELYVLAYDGVYLQAPRLQRSVYIPAGGKTDVAVSCRTPGKHVITTTPAGVEEFGGTVLDSHVVLALDTQPASSGRRPMPLPAKLPGPPAYYADLLHTKPDMTHTVRMSDFAGGNNVDGVPYSGSVSFTMPHGSVQEWYIGASQSTGFLSLHSYHQHFTHFQIVETSINNGIVATVGDYRDTVILYRDLNYTIRFVAPFEGLMMIHCHITKHQDLGMMTLANITAAPVELALFSEAPWAHRFRILSLLVSLVSLAGCLSMLFAYARIRGEAMSSCGCYRQCPGEEPRSYRSYAIVGVSHEVA
jgi:FtsP/CotA-like multicopper oxidase with cupredoxin domain